MRWITRALMAVVLISSAGCVIVPVGGHHWHHYGYASATPSSATAARLA